MKRSIEHEEEEDADMATETLEVYKLDDSRSDITATGSALFAPLSEASVRCTECATSLFPTGVADIFMCGHCDKVLCGLCKERLPSCCGCSKKLCTGCVEESACSMCGIAMCFECAEGEAVASFTCCGKHKLICSACENRYVQDTCSVCRSDACDLVAQKKEKCLSCSEIVNVKLDIKNTDQLMEMVKSQSLRLVLESWRVQQIDKLAKRGFK